MIPENEAAFAYRLGNARQAMHELASNVTENFRTAQRIEEAGGQVPEGLRQLAYGAAATRLATLESLVAELRATHDATEPVTFNQEGL